MDTTAFELFTDVLFWECGERARTRASAAIIRAPSTLWTICSSCEWSFEEACLGLYEYKTALFRACYRVV